MLHLCSRVAPVGQRCRFVCFGLGCGMPGSHNQLHNQLRCPACLLQDCTVSSGVCEAGESAPGLWEFPLYTCQLGNGTILSAMDPPGDMFEVYEREFENRYYGGLAGRLGEGGLAGRCSAGGWRHASQRTAGKPAYQSCVLGSCQHALTDSP